MTEPSDYELRLQAQACPFIAGAMASGDEAVLTSAMKVHPPDRCAHVEKASAS